MAGDWFKRGWAGVRRADLRIWTARQRAALAAIVLALVVVLLIVSFRRPLHIADPQPVVGARSRELATRIDPNEADWPALAVLPLIGEKRARDIVAYREAYLRKNPGRRAFERIEDLDNVNGIGEGTAEALRPHLLIPPSPKSP